MEILSDYRKPLCSVPLWHLTSIFFLHSTSCIKPAYMHWGQHAPPSQSLWTCISCMSITNKKTIKRISSLATTTTRPEALTTVAQSVMHFKLPYASIPSVFICVCIPCFCFMLHTCHSIVSMVGWTWWDWSLILRTKIPSVLWHLDNLTGKKPSQYDL